MGLRTSSEYVSRGGDKLVAALDDFRLEVSGLTCADFGSHTGGFVDCLLRRGAARVYAIDTAYGILAWKLRRDPRVVVMERANAMHVTLPEPVDLITIDVGWTRQERILPNAAALLKPGGRVLALVKPHYEADPSMLTDGILPVEKLDEVVAQVISQIATDGWTLLGTFPSPLPGHGGNREVFALLHRSTVP